MEPKNHYEIEIDSKSSLPPIIHRTHNNNENNNNGDNNNNNDNEIDKPTKIENSFKKSYLIPLVILINIVSPYTIYKIYKKHLDPINYVGDDLKDEFSLLIHIYRSMWSLLLLLFLSSLNIYVWEFFNIEYISIFKLKDYLTTTTTTITSDIDNNDNNNNNLEDNRSPFNILFKKSLVLSIILFISLFMESINEGYGLNASIFTWVCFFVILLHEKFIRSIVVENLILIIKAPFRSITFLSFWIADQITSLSIFLKDFNISLCYLLSFLNIDFCVKQFEWLSTIIFSLPFIFRINQCLRVYYDTGNKSQIFNAIKYFMGLIVLFFSSLYHNNHGEGNEHFKIYWIIFAITATLYSSYWDIVKDWGLFERSSKNFLLRDVLLYGNHKSFYYYSIISNLVMRFMWVILINPLEFGFTTENEVLLGTFLISIDIVRRCQWNIIRLEYEQIQHQK